MLVLVASGGIYIRLGGVFDSGSLRWTRPHLSSENIQNTTGREYHIGLAPGEVPVFLMLMSDASDWI